MKIAFLHFDFCGGPQSANTEKILHGMKIAAAAGAEWILTPEMALQGYFMVKSEKKYVLASITNGSYEPFKEAAADLGVRLFLGCGEQEDNTAPHNSCVVIDQKGKVIAKHNKVKIVKWITENWAEPGNGFKVHCFDEVQTGLLVCADPLPPGLTAIMEVHRRRHGNAVQKLQVGYRFCFLIKQATTVWIAVKQRAQLLKTRKSFVLIVVMKQYYLSILISKAREYRPKILKLWDWLDGYETFFHFMYIDAVIFRCRQRGLGYGKRSFIKI